jgi:5-methylcytosine-specific restriction endonuclease McrA
VVHLVRPRLLGPADCSRLDCSLPRRSRIDGEWFCAKHVDQIRKNRKYRESHQPVEVCCLTCGVTFKAEVGDNRRKFCGKKCLSSFGTAKKRPPELDIQRVCFECAASFCPVRTYQAFCSIPCQRKNLARARNHKRRAEQKALPYERVNPVTIHERDGWICKLQISDKCKGHSLRGKMGTSHPQAPEMDHIVPHSLGGATVKSNLQSSCRACNQMKGNRPIGQLRVF